MTTLSRGAQPQTCRSSAFWLRIIEKF